MLNFLIVDEIIKSALKEDAPYGDVTVSSIVSEGERAQVNLISKEAGIICGLQVFKRVFEILGKVEVELLVKDGDLVSKGMVIGHVIGDASNILIGERIALNLLQRMSGIATLTNKYVKKLEGFNTQVLDTRKTTPNMRIFEKYAVKIGGGCNHRYNLSDSVLIKENHISAAGGLKEAVTIIRENVSFVKKIEVEVETLEQIKEALEVGVDIIMLDNMDVPTMKKAVGLINKKSLIEASGNVTLNNIATVASSGVDYISVGALTHSYKVLDLSMKNLVNS